MKLLVSDHAVERYVRRIAPGITLAQARLDLEARAASARRTTSRTGSGEEYWDAGDCRLVVRVGRGRADRAQRIVVTVVEAEAPIEELAS